MDKLKTYFPDVWLVCTKYPKEVVKMFLRNIVAMNADTHLVVIASSILETQI